MNNDIINFMKFVQLDSYDIDYENTDVWVPLSPIEDTIAHLYLKPNEKDRTCPHCGHNYCVIKDRILKKFPHPILADRHIMIYFYQIKFKCKCCGRHHLQNNPLTRDRKSITLAGEMYILDKLRNPRKTFQDIADEFYIPKTSVIRVFDSYVNISRHPLGKVLCFDEFYAKKLTKTKYCFGIYDFLSGEVIDILDARRKNVLEDYFYHIPISERLNVEYVNIDMWDTYAKISYKMFPKAVICIDSFHVIKHLTKAMDDIRKRIQKKFLNHKDDDRNGYYWLLKTFHYYFTTNMDNIKYTRRPNSHYSYLFDKHDVLAKLLSISEELKEAYYLKEEYREFNHYGSYDEALIRIPILIDKFKSSKFHEFREFGKMLKRWETEIINSFITVNGKRNSNGPMESLNGRIKNIIRNGYGYKNFRRLRNKVMYSLNRQEPIRIT